MTQVLVSQTLNMVFVTTTGNRSARPACATNTNWVFNYISSQGQGLLNAMMAAKINGFILNISGTGNCLDLNGYESINYLVLP